MTTPTTANTDRPRAKGYDLRIGTNLFRMVASPEFPFIRQTADAIPERVSLEQNAEEMGDRITRTVSRNDFRGGRGLELAHRPGASQDDRTRYWEGEGLDLFRRVGNRQSLKLGGAQEELGPTAASGGDMGVVYDGRVYVRDGTNMRRSQSGPWGSAVTWSTVTTGFATGYPAAGVAHDGLLYVYEAAHGLWSYDGSTFTDELVTLASSPIKLFSAKQRIFAANGARFDEIDLVNNTADNLVTDENAARHLAAFEAGPWLVLVTKAHGVALDKKSRIRIFGEETGSLVQEGYIEVRDRILGATYSHGFLFWISESSYDADLQLWRGRITNSGELVDLTNLGDFEYTGTNETSGTDMPVTENHLYFYANQSDLSTTIWRLDLATMGVHRHLDTPTSGTSYSSNRRLLAVEGEVWLVEHYAASPFTTFVRRWDHDDFASSGYIILPLLDLYTAQAKEWLDITAWYKALAVSDESIVIKYSTDPDAISDSGHGSWTTLATLTTGSGGSPISLSSVNSRWLAVMVEMNASTDQSVTPEIYGIAIRAYSGSGATQYQIPINVSDHVERPNRQRLRVRGRGEAIYAVLAGLEGTQQTVEVYRPAQTITGIITRVSAPITVKTDRGSSLQVALVTIEGE